MSKENEYNNIGVWDCTFYMLNEDGNTLCNQDGTVKIFDAPKLDWSHIAEYVDYADLEEIKQENNK